MRRDEALAVLGLAPGVDAATVRRRFRALARELHPDRGGDPAAFAELDRAYAVLRAAPGPARPRVARGRPSRRPASAVASSAAADATDLATALLARHDPATGRARLRLASVAPGSRRNRLAGALPSGTIGLLELRLAPGPAAAEVRLTVRSRAARRAVASLPLDDPDLAATWTRRRGDAALELRCTPRVGAPAPVDRSQPSGPTGPADPGRAAAEAAAGAVAGAAARLLTALGWPATEWVLEP